MRVLVFPDRDAAIGKTVEAVVRQLAAKPGSVLGLATGGTMEAVYNRLAARHEAGGVSFAGAPSFNLDKYVGLAPDDPRPYHRYMREQLFARVDFAPGATALPEGDAEAPSEAAAFYEAAIRMVYQGLGLLDTRLGLGLVLAVVNLPLALVLLVNAVAEVPVELDEAARVDGVTRGQILRHVIVPLCRPALVVTFVFGFITAWNEFLFGLMLTPREAVPVTVGASFFFATGGAGIQWGVASAVMLVAALPPMVLGLVMYRQLTGSLTAGAVKG